MFHLTAPNPVPISIYTKSPIAKLARFAKWKRAGYSLMANSSTIQFGQSSHTNYFVAVMVSDH